MRPVLRRTAVTLCALALASWTLRGDVPPASSFAAQIERLSESGGTFDTDNLISNERAYLDVIPALMSGGVTGGAYIGVGPDQNFSYIARIRPSVAFIIDVRRDNLLLHLLFKALFARSRTRVEYLSLLTGRAPPGDLDRWNAASLNAIVAYIDGAEAAPGAAPVLRRRLEDTIGGFGVPLTRADFDTIDRFHHAFIADGLSLQFHSFNRAPQAYYPNLRELLLAKDANGHLWNYLASEDDFQFVRSLQVRDQIIPVVGDVAGPHALAAIAAAVAERHEHVSAFYISNVENYLFRDGQFARYTENLARLPRTPRTVVIRSIFSGGGQSLSAVQPLEEMMSNVAHGRYRDYADVIR